MQALELAQSAIEGALDGGVVAVEEAEIVQGAADAEHVAELEGAVDVGESRADAILTFEVADIEIAFFGAASAAGAPSGVDDLVKDDVFDGADGLEVAAEFLEEAVELRPTLAHDDGLVGGESVLEGVAAGGGAAGGGARAGGLAGVAAVGRAAGGGRHRLRLLWELRIESELRKGRN
ncbi:MAG TPA: hypothetical protein VEU62_19825 [Bryobacterales bacterium]|nr:hypothetical protein [Bryobacterales bacterium]